MNIPQYAPTISEEDINSVNNYMKSGGFITEFRQSRKFEEYLAQYCKCDNAILFPNGTLTMYAIIKCLNLKDSDKVLVPNFTMAATAFAPLEANYNIKFVDIEYPQLTLNLEIIKRELDNDPTIKVIMLVSANGREPSCGIEKILNFCKSKDLYLIEDAAQGLGSNYKNGKPVGSLSFASSISFSMPKIITTGQGGVVLTNNKDFEKKLRSFRDFGRTESGNDLHHNVGLNLKFTDLQATLGISQLSQIDQKIKNKKNIYNIYKSNIKSDYVKVISNPENVTPWFIEVLSKYRDELKSYLASFQIGTRVMYPPLNKQNAFKSHPQNNITFPISEMIGECGLWLPSFAHLTNEEIKFIISQINKFKPKNI